MSLCESRGFPGEKEISAERPVADKSVAVLLATFNGEKYLREFLDSLRAQNYKDFCIYVRDDGSSDATLDILTAYENELDIRHLHGGERLGAFQNFFQLLQVSGNDHACYMLADQDDYWYPDKIERAWQAVGDCSEDIILYCTRLEYADAKLNSLGFSKIPRMLAFENAVVENIASGCTIAVTWRVKRNLVIPDARYSIAHDWWLYLYCSAAGKVIYDERPSLQYRLHFSNTIGATTSRLKELKRRIQRHIKNEHIFLHLSQQFLLCYGHALSQQHRDLLQNIIKNAQTLRGRLSMALQPPFSRQRQIDNLILRMIYLLGRF